MVLTATAWLALAGGAISAPVFIENARARVEAGRMVVDVTADGPLDVSSARAKLTGRRLYLYLDDTRVRGRRSWGRGAEEIVAHRHRDHLSLEVPFPPHGGCEGPARVQAGAERGSLSVVIACPRAVAAAAVAPEFAKPAEGGTGKARGEVAIAPDLPAPASDLVALVNEPHPAYQGAHPTAAPSPGDELPSPAATAPAMSAGYGEESSRASWGWIVALIIGVAGAAVAWWRRGRRSSPDSDDLRDAGEDLLVDVAGKRLKVLESTPAGPGRTLILAEMDGRPTLLAAGESGVSFVATEARPPGPSVAKSPAADDRAAPALQQSFFEAAQLRHLAARFATAGKSSR